MRENFSDTHECWWIADHIQDVEHLKNIGVEYVTHATSAKAKELYQKANVYVTENFRESYPNELSDQTLIFNTWHGVGLKHIELALGEKSVLSDSIVKKYIKNYQLYKDRTYFLATSPAMEKHFIQDTVIAEDKIIHGGYPRNIVYKNNISTYMLRDIVPHNNYVRTILFAPTYRINAIDGIFQYLLPDIERLHQVLMNNNDLLIIKVHPFMTKDAYFQDIKKQYEQSENIIFWNDEYDIYEIFDKIDIAIVDYSSIFYDLLEAGVNKFIRYIPDYKEYSGELEFIDDYFSLTGGKIIQSFSNLLSALDHNIPNIKNKKKLMAHFFAYSKENNLNQIINKIDNIVIKNEKHKELHSFDVFDTLIRRKTLTPFSIFFYMQKVAAQSNMKFSQYFLENWPKIRNQAEHDLRDMYKKTVFERKTDKVEVTFDAIYSRIQKHMNLSIDQINFLKNLEIQAELEHVEPIKERINFLFEKKAQGHDVILVSDMYLPITVIKKMLEKVDKRLSKIKLYLSSEIGYQKSTGKLYKHIFFDLNYCYKSWIHYGDNVHADGNAARRFGIKTVVHHMDAYIPFESNLIESSSTFQKYDAYQLATKMHRYREKLLSCENNEKINQKYYAYAYAGTAFVPYVYWCILDALKRGYETLYFISRDGHFLKLIADEIIRKKGYTLKTKYIYGSRKAWRIPSFIEYIDEETFGPFGSFVGMDSFQDLVKASWLEENELLDLFPQFESLRNAKHLRGAVAENIRKTFANSDLYKSKILKIAREKRNLVTQYLKQEINFDESFAFVEFWGRGYTQDTFGRLLNEAAGKHVNNIFYYVRSFSEDKENVVRHNFILTPQNFSYFEPIFASTPYESISGYQYNDTLEKVEPIIIAKPNHISQILEDGLIDFTSDYLDVNVNNEIDFAYSVAKISYDYQFKTYDDQFICNVFGSLKDNISSYGDVKEYAPILTLSALESVKSKQDLDVLTSSIAISLARSDENVRKWYQKYSKKFKLPTIKPTEMKLNYVVNNLSLYALSRSLPFKAISMKNNALFMDVSFSENTKSDYFLKKYETFDVIKIDWLKNGVPRLLTNYGYVTAHKDWVQKLEDVDDVLVKKEKDGHYVSIKPEQTYKKEVTTIRTTNHSIESNIKDRVNNVSEKTNYILEQISSINKKEKLVSEPTTYTDWERKWNKFTRDPYLFFADAKNPKVAQLKNCFNEDNRIGRILTKLVRHKL